MIHRFGKEEIKAVTETIAKSSFLSGYTNKYLGGEEIQKFEKDDFQRKKIAKMGKQKYMKYFNSTIVADYIIKNTFDIPYKKRTFMWESK